MMRRILVALIATFTLTGAAHAELARWFTGNPTDVKPRLHGPILDLAGGGRDVEPALQMMIDLVRGCTSCETTVDVVVLRASGADGYNPLFIGLNGVNSVTTMLVTDAQSAVRPEVVATVRNAEIVFYAGGDQCNYARWFRGNELQRAVESVYKRGGGIGGTSAGLAIQSDVIYDACPSQSAQSTGVLMDPYSPDVSLSRFFHWRYMEATISDTHFRQRDRLGRLITFIARGIHDGLARTLLGIGVNERTSVIVDAAGKAHVIGESGAYLVLGEHKPELCEPGKPLTFKGVKIWKMAPGETFDLTHRPKENAVFVDVIEGKLSADPY